MSRFMALRSFLSVSELLPDVDAASLRGKLERMARTAHELGLRPKESWFSLDARSLFTLFDSDSEERIRELHRRSGFGEPRIMPVERVFTELLGQPHRAR